MQGSWEVHLDPERAVRLDLKGSFDASEDKTKADAGETDIYVETSGTITATNISDGRATEELDTGLQLFIPIASCPDWKRTITVPLGSHCSRDLVSFEIPDLDVGESADIDISGRQRDASVKTEEAPVIIAAMLGASARVVSADRVFGNPYLDELNPTCEKGELKWVTYYTEDPSVTACSTEPG